MRLAIFGGLLYVAWCINPTTFDTLVTSQADLWFIWIITVLAFFGDFIDLRNAYRRRNLTK